MFRALWCQSLFIPSCWLGFFAFSTLVTHGASWFRISIIRAHHYTSQETNVVYQIQTWPQHPHLERSVASLRQLPLHTPTMEHGEITSGLHTNHWKWQPFVTTNFANFDKRQNKLSLTFFSSSSGSMCSRLTFMRPRWPFWSSEQLCLFDGSFWGGACLSPAPMAGWCKAFSSSPKAILRLDLKGLWNKSHYKMVKEVCSCRNMLYPPKSNLFESGDVQFLLRHHNFGWT